MWLALVALSVVATACTPEVTDFYTADPSSTTEVALKENLSEEQVQAVRAAILEINTAIGHEVFVEGDHPTVTISADVPNQGNACTYRKAHSAHMAIGSVTRVDIIEHEFFHVLLGSEHSTDPSDVFYYSTQTGSWITDGTVERVLSIM